MKVAEAATEENATLKSVGEKFDVNPTLVRNWKIQFASTLGSGENKTSKDKTDRDTENMGTNDGELGSGDQSTYNETLLEGAMDDLKFETSLATIENLDCSIDEGYLATMKAQAVI